MIKSYLYGGIAVLITIVGLYVYYLQSSLESIKLENNQLTVQLSENVEATKRLRDNMKANEEATMKLQERVGKIELARAKRVRDINAIDFNSMKDSEVQERVNNEVNKAFTDLSFN